MNTLLKNCHNYDKSFVIVGEKGVNREEKVTATADAGGGEDERNVLFVFK